MYDPKFEQDFLKHIPAKLKETYLRFLVLNIGLLADQETRENTQKFLYYLISRESIETIKKEGSIILYNDPNLKTE